MGLIMAPKIIAVLVVYKLIADVDTKRCHPSVRHFLIIKKSKSKPEIHLPLAIIYIEISPDKNTAQL